MLQPKEIVLTLQNGEQRTFLLSKFPAVAGREIVAKYPVSNIPKIGEYQQSEEVMLKLMAFVARVGDDGKPVMLSTRALVDNHVGDWETLAKLEWSQLEYNTSFFGAGRNSASFAGLIEKAAGSISSMLTPLLATLSQAEKPPSKN